MPEPVVCPPPVQSKLLERIDYLEEEIGESHHVSLLRFFKKKQPQHFHPDHKAPSQYHPQRASAVNGAAARASLTSNAKQSTGLFTGDEPRLAKV